jgi:hypothetical protein
MLEGLTPRSKEALCFLMKKATTELDDKDLKILLDAVDDPRWTANGLTDALSQRGFIVSRGVIQNHRAKTCACAR